MARKINFAPGEFYHLYNRGTEKRNIFSTKKDHERFLSLLYLCNGSLPVDAYFQGETVGEVKEVERGEPLIDVGAYCLMPNHFHLLVREVADGGISRFMQKLSTGYTMYFNNLHERTGSLFQGRFKSTHVQNDRYLKYLMAYIHLNPVKLVEPKWKESGIQDRKNAAHFLEGYLYSSYLDYLGHDRDEEIILTKKALPDYFEKPGSFNAHIMDWLNYQEN